MAKTDGNPMHLLRVAEMHAAPRCKALSKRSGHPCRAPAVNGWKVCRMHGAGGGAPTGKENGAYKHGTRTAEFQSLRRAIRELRAQSAKTLKSIRKL